MILKKNAKPRKKKRELIMERQQRDADQQHMRYLLDAEATLNQKKINIEDAITALNDNELMKRVSNNNNSFGQDGQIKV